MPSILRKDMFVSRFAVIALIGSALLIASCSETPAELSTAPDYSQQVIVETAVAQSVSATVAALPSDQAATPGEAGGENIQLAPSVLPKQDEGESKGQTEELPVADHDTPVPPTPPLTATPFPKQPGLSYLDLDGAAIAFFSREESNRLVPDDVLEEISFFGQAGGGEFCTAPHASWPFFEHSTDISESNGRIVIRACIANQNEEVLIEMTKPDGAVVSETDPGGTVWFSYGVTLQDPLGSYRVVLRSGPEEIAHATHVVEPEGPRLYTLSDQLVLYNFAPNERVRMLAFAPTNAGLDARLDAWSEYQTDFKGRLIIRLDDSVTADLEGFTYVIVGAFSGEVHPQFGDSLYATAALATGHRIEPSGIILTSPDLPDLLGLTDLASLWMFTEFKDLREPGKNVYDVQLPHQEKHLWRFSWCATTIDLLPEILEPLDLRFLVDDAEISMGHFVESYEQRSNGWACKWWATTVENWPSEQSVRLSVKYELLRDIYDGAVSFPAGNYEHEIRVSVQQ